VNKRFLLAALALLLAGPGSLSPQDPYSQSRLRMVRDQIQQRGIRNQAVLEAMRATPRHLFVPDAQRDSAYQDHPLPIGYSQTISQPYIVAFMTELLDVAKSHRVLEIGTGSGYQAAVLSPLAGQVYTIEIVPELAKRSASLLEKLGYANVTVRLGDGYKGWPEKAPFDRIILTAAPPELPQALVDQLKPGGRLVAPVGGSSWTQELILVEKSANGKLSRRSVLDVRFVPMVRGGR
jgi:protein-L-isoaspartate(D-aspartate) O-methyltransferase